MASKGGTKMHREGGTKMHREGGTKMHREGGTKMHSKAAENAQRCTAKAQRRLGLGYSEPKRCTKMHKDAQSEHK
jgi:hypothetical protein